MVLGGIGMREAETFEHRGYEMLLYESADPDAAARAGAAR
jgi:hypothetical protein